VSVNRSWDEHCKQLEVAHSHQMSALNDELADFRRRLDDRQRSDDDRQREFDELLLSAKKQRQDEEVVHLSVIFIDLSRTSKTNKLWKSDTSVSLWQYRHVLH